MLVIFSQKGNYTRRCVVSTAVWFLRHGRMLYPISKQNISIYFTERLIIFQRTVFKYLELEILQVHNLKRNQGRRPPAAPCVQPLSCEEPARRKSCKNIEN